MKLRVLVVAIALSLAATACGGDSSAALSFRDTSVSQAELMAELREVARNSDYVKNQLQLDDPRQKSADGKSTLGYDRAFVTAVLNQRALLEIVTRECKRRKIAIDDTAKQQMEQQYTDPATNKSIFADFSKDYRAELIYGYTCFNLLPNAPNGFSDIDAAQRWLTAALKDVKINSRYGTWDPNRGTIIEPGGPLHGSTTTTTFPVASN